MGAVLKGAAGAGLPVFAIPAIATLYDVRIAVVLLVIPNFITNVWQILRYREHDLDNNLARNLTLSGMAGVALGTFLLAYLSLFALNIVIALVVFLYIVLRLLRPEFNLPMHIMRKWELVAGSCAGILQGAVGLSSPITITFLHAGSLPRLTFVYSASLFFCCMSIVQVPLQSALGLMTWELAGLSMLTLIPILMGMPIGEQIGKKMSTVMFDRIILTLLTFLAIKMLADAFLRY